MGENRSWRHDALALGWDFYGVIFTYKYPRIQERRARVTASRSAISNQDRSQGCCDAVNCKALKSQQVSAGSQHRPGPCEQDGAAPRPLGAGAQCALARCLPPDCLDCPGLSSLAAHETSLRANVMATWTNLGQHGPIGIKSIQQRRTLKRGGRWVSTMSLPRAIWPFGHLWRGKAFRGQSGDLSLMGGLL